MKLKRCLACNSSNLFKVIDLGKQPLANNYGENKKYPLVLNACKDCDHAQLSISVDPKKLFTHYLYESGTSETLKSWFSGFALHKVKGSVLDIASNDGTLLRECKQLGHKVQGIDPAENLKPKGIPTRVEFFGEDTKFSKKFDTITAFNVIAHTPNPLSIMKGIYNNLADKGTAWVMCSQGSQFDKGQFDTIYHEHHSFYSERSMQILANRAGLEVVGCSVQPIHGGSLLFRLRKHKAIDFSKYAKDVDKVVSDAKKFTPSHKMVGVGAAAKGVVFINATGINLDAVVDEATIKWGHDIPGTNIPIISMNELPDEPVTFIYLAWNFYDELSKKIKSKRKYKDEHVRFFQ